MQPEPQLPAHPQTPESPALSYPMGAAAIPPGGVRQTAKSRLTQSSQHLMDATAIQKLDLPPRTARSLLRSPSHMAVAVMSHNNLIKTKIRLYFYERSHRLTHGV